MWCEAAGGRLAPIIQLSNPAGTDEARPDAASRTVPVRGHPWGWREDYDPREHIGIDAVHTPASITELRRCTDSLIASAPRCTLLSVFFFGVGLARLHRATRSRSCLRETTYSLGRLGALSGAGPTAFARASVRAFCPTLAPRGAVSNAAVALGRREGFAENAGDGDGGGIAGGCRGGGAVCLKCPILGWIC